MLHSLQDGGVRKKLGAKKEGGENWVSRGMNEAAMENAFKRTHRKGVCVARQGQRIFRYVLLVLFYQLGTS